MQRNQRGRGLHRRGCWKAKQEPSPPNAPAKATLQQPGPVPLVLDTVTELLELHVQQLHGQPQPELEEEQLLRKHQLSIANHDTAIPEFVPRATLDHPGQQLISSVLSPQWVAPPNLPNIQ